MAGEFAPTHRAPASGMDTWQEPGSVPPSGQRLPAGLPVRQVRAWGDWALVACDNGWEAWVDRRRLEPLAPPGHAPAPPSMGSPDPPFTRDPVGTADLDRSPIRVGRLTLSAPLVGAAVAVVACFLPWFSINGQGVAAFKLPVAYLVKFDAKASGVDLGWLVAALALAAVGLVVHPVSSQARKAVGWALVLVASMFVAQTQRAVGQAEAGGVFGTLGLGVYLTLAGGLLVARGGGEVR